MAVYMYQLDNRFCSKTFVYENDCQSLCHEHRCQETHNVAFSQIHGLDKKNFLMWILNYVWGCPQLILDETYYFHW